MQLPYVKSAAASSPQVQPIPRLSMYSQYPMCIYTQQEYIPHINTDRKHSAHVNTNSTNCLIRFTSLTGQDESLLVENTYKCVCACVCIYICTRGRDMYNIPPITGLWTPSLSTNRPWIFHLPSCWHLGMLPHPQAHSPTPAASTDALYPHTSPDTHPWDPFSNCPQTLIIYPTALDPLVSSGLTH